MPETSTEVRRQMRISARPETVYSYFTDPAKYVRWKGVEARLEPTPGGEYWVRVDDTHVASGRFVEVVPNSRLVFTWGWEGDSHVPPGSSTVEVTLAPEGSATLLTLVHRDLPNEKASAIHAEGWDFFLPRLVEVAGGSV